MLICPLKALLSFQGSLSGEAALGGFAMLCDPELAEPADCLTPGKETSAKAGAAAVLAVEEEAASVA